MPRDEMVVSISLYSTWWNWLIFTSNPLLGIIQMCWKWANSEECYRKIYTYIFVGLFIGGLTSNFSFYVVFLIVLETGRGRTRWSWGLLGRNRCSQLQPILLSNWIHRFSSLKKLVVWKSTLQFVAWTLNHITITEQTGRWAREVLNQRDQMGIPFNYMM